MSTHLAHKLPWASLGEVIAATHPTQHRGTREPTRKQLPVVYHFAKCLVAALQEFAASDKSSEGERTRYDAARWTRLGPTSHWPHVGYYDALINGYVELNLLLSDPDVFTDMMTGHNRCMSEMITGLLEYGESPTQWLEVHLRLALNGRYLKSLTAEVLQVLRDHCALFFRCLYSIRGENKALDVDFVMMTISWRFQFVTRELYCWPDQYHTGQSLAEFFKATE